jgi:predicted methyltransferase
MKSLFKKLKRSTRYYYYSQKNGWYFPSNMAHISGGKMANNTYEPDVSKKITEILEQGSIFIDVGANVGYFSRLASGEVGTNGNVYAFEIDSENYYALLQNIDTYSNIYSLNLAISNEDAFIKVNHSSHSA